ncbi:MAG: hypothetical protein HDS31_00715 [Bacteroides sp.]|nr:hypothetical protein [Bacteroides sp.]
MKKALLLAGACLLAAGSASAATAFYPPVPEIMGDAISVSSNGRWAVVSDTEMSYGYLWDAENPTEYTRVVSGLYDKVNIYGVSDDCLMVGQVYLGDGKWRPAIRKGIVGDWELLDVDPYTLNSAEATCVSSDGKYIAGWLMIKGDEEADGPLKGAYYPAQWTLNDKGGYDYKAFYDFDTLGQQGFITYCQSNDGRVIGGMIHAGCSDAFLPAIIIDGKFKMFDEVVYKNEPWYYKDQIMGYDDVSYINGFKDDQSNNTFVGMFQGVDYDGNLYGCRTIAKDVDEEGNGTLENYACIYNYEKDEWQYTDKVRAFSIGHKADVIYCNNARMITGGIDGEISSIKETLDFGQDFSQQLTGILSISEDNKTLGGCYQVLNPASGEYQYFPFMLVVDGDFNSVEIVNDGNAPVAIVVSNGNIEFVGAEGVVYDLNGRLVGQGANVNVAAGTYVAKVGNESRTVIVK